MSSSREFRFPAVFQISFQRLQQVPPMYTDSHMHSLQDALNPFKHSLAMCSWDPHPPCSVKPPGNLPGFQMRLINHAYWEPVLTDIPKVALGHVGVDDKLFVSFLLKMVLSVSSFLLKASQIWSSWKYMFLCHTITNPVPQIIASSFCAEIYFLGSVHPVNISSSNGFPGS